MSGAQSQDMQDYYDQLPARMAAQQQPQAQPSPAIDTDTTTRPDRLPPMLPAPINDPTKPIIMATGTDSTTVGADTDKTSWADYAKAAWQRVEGMGAGALGAASLTARKLGADPDTVQHIEQMRAGVAQSIEDSVSSMTPAAQKALHASVFGGQDENGEHIPTPGEVGWKRFIGLQAASFIPDGILAAVTARVAGPMALPLLGAFYGTTQAGDAYGKLVDEVDKTKPQDWAGSPAMQAMLQQGMSFTDAKKQIVDHAANQLGALNFGIGALTGAGGMGLLMRGPLGAAGKGLLARLGLSATEGAATLGLQSGGEEFAQENATNQAGLTNGFDTDKLARSAASGALGGIVIGAAGGALHGSHGAAPATLNPKGEETATPGPNTGLVSPELQAALDTGTTPSATGEGTGNVGDQHPAPVGRPTAFHQPPLYEVPGTNGEVFDTQAGLDARAEQAKSTTLPALPDTSQALASTEATPNVPGAGSSNVSAGGGVPGTPAGGPRPSDGVARKDLIDAVQVATGADRKTLNRMSIGDLRTRFDATQPATKPDMGVTQSTPEPQRDIDAQIAAVADKSNPKDAMFVAKGSPEPSTRPKGVFKASRDEGTLYTTNAKKVAAFKKPDLSDENLGQILGYTESKADAVKSGAPTVVQAKDANGAVVHDQLASPEGLKKAQAAAQERTPEGGSVVVTTPEEGQARRAQEVAQAPAEPPATRDEPKAETLPAPVAAAAAPMSAAERLKAKRAAQKAAMAPPGERMKGTVATVEASEPTRTSSTGKSEGAVVKADPLEGSSVGETLAKVKTTMDHTRRDIVPLKKGADIDRVMQQVVKELSGRFKDAKNNGDVLESLAKWGRSDPNPLPGTRTRRIQIADRIMTSLIGKTVDEFSGRAQRVRAELAREPAQEVRYEKDANREDMTEGERTVTHAVGEPTTVVEKEPTKIVDQLPHWLGRVLSGDMSVQEAHEAYGLPKGNGRPRKYPTFSDYLDDRIRMAEDPQEKERLLQRMAALKDMPTSQAKSAETNRINMLLDTTGTEAADRLRELKAELDPVRAAADEEAPKEAAAEKLRKRLAEIRAGKTLGMPGSYGLKVMRPEFNHAVDAMIEADKPRPLKDYLDTIAKDGEVNQSVPLYVSLARRMRDLVHDNVEVVRGADEGFTGQFYQGNERGTGTVGLRVHPNASSVETVLHEGLHSVTSHYFDSLPDNHPDRQALDAMHSELQHALDTSTGLTARERDAVEYALTNPHELHTMLMTNPEVQALAASHTPSFQFRAKMHALGYVGQAAKSVWAAFTAFVRKAVGLKGMADPRSMSLLDHLIRPLQDITERAAEFNREPGAADAREKMLGLPDFNPKVRERVDDALRTVDLKTANDKLMHGALASSTSDGIVKWNTPLFESRDKEAPGNSIKDYQRADEAVSARKKAFSDKYADQINDWAKSIQGPDRDKLASLLVDASTANVKLGPGADNSHLTTVEQKARLKALQARYDALKSTSRAAYDASHKLQDAMYAEEREARLNSMLKGVMKGATKDQIDAIRDVAKSKKSLTAFLTNPDNSAIASKFGTEWDSARALVKGIARIHKLGFVDGDYFPLRRYGDYVLSYGEKGTESYGMERFTTIAKGEARRAELLAQKAENLSQVQSVRENHLRDMVSMPAIDEITAAMAKRGDLKEHIDAMHDLMASVVMQHATHSEGARARLRRQGVLGASKDVEKVVAQDYMATAARIGYLEHGVDRAQALQRMQDHADMLGMDGKPGEQRVAQAVVKELQKRTSSSDEGDSVFDKILRKASAFGYIQSLQSFSHMFTSTFEAHTNSIPLLGARHGPVQASVALTKALKDSLPVLGTGAKNAIKAVGKGLRASDWNLSTVVRDQMIKNGADAGHMKKLFDALNAAGLLDHTFVRELMRMANPSNQRLTKLAGWWGKFMDLNAAGAHAVDVANKSAIAKAAFDLELRKTGDVNKAVDYAMDMARSAMPNYNATNKARIARGLLSPAMQFKNYGIHMYSMMGNLVHEWTHGATPEARKEARNALAGIVIMHTLTAGVIAGSPLGDILRWFGGAYDLVTGETKPHDYENDVRRMIADVAGPELGEAISRGLLEMLGISVHHRIGLSNLLEPPELKSFDQKGLAMATETAITGAAGEDATTLLGGLAKLRQGDLAGAITAITPREFRDVYKAYRLSDVGVTDSKGQTIMAPGSLSGMDFVYQALGFIPSDVTEFREGRNAVLEAREGASGEHSHLIQQWVRADPEDRADLMDTIQAYNVRNPGQKITADTLLKAAKQHRDAMRQANAASFGLTLPKKARSYLSNAGSFANVPLQ